MPVVMGQLQNRGPKSLVRAHGHTKDVRDLPREADRITLDDQIQVVMVVTAEQRIADDAADCADVPGQMWPQPRHHRVSEEVGCKVGTIHMVIWDPLSEKLVENSPLRNPALVAAFSRYEHLTITELDVAWDETNVAFREWIEQPENVGKPIQDAPQYWDRIAIDSLRERRTWWE
jgi:hypothetical protein